MDHRVNCAICNQEYTNIIGTLIVDCNDNYEVTQLVLNGVHHIPANVKYDFRSQGNIHILFICKGNGHFFIKSYDGHKGTTYIDSNSLMNSLALYLTSAYKKKDCLPEVDTELINHIQNFLASRAIKTS